MRLFGVWGIDLMIPFVPSNKNNLYILVAGDYVSKYVEGQAFPTNDSKLVTRFLNKNIFTIFISLKAIISDEGAHFCDNAFNVLLAKYGVKHKIAIAYHPLRSSQAEISNMEIKRILEKVVSPTRKIGH